MTVKALGYIGVAAKDLARWKDYATGVLGMQVVDDTDDLLTLRMDDKYCRWLIHRSDAEGPAYYGWDVGSEESLHEVCKVLEDAGHHLTPGDAEDAHQRRVLEFIRVDDPAGNHLELFYGQRTGLGFHPGRPMTRFVTGRLGMGHIAAMTTELQACVGFYQQLGFRISDKAFMTPVNGYGIFLRCNPREHSVAFVPGPANTLHHVMLEVDSLRDVGTSHEEVLRRGIPVTMSLGQHINDHVFSFYHASPGGFDIEVGHGGMTIEDDANWQVAEYDDISFWGHHGPMRPPPAA